MSIEDYRSAINGIDGQILALFKERMETAEQIGLFKRERGLPIIDHDREREILCRLTEGADPALQGYIRVLFNTLFEMSRSYQAKTVLESKTVKLIERALEDTPKVFPATATVACQGVEGAFSQMACDRLFTLPNIMYCGSFEAVFQAVDKGLCRYGVLPLENSAAGSVNEVYDLLNQYRFTIARSCRLNVRHMLLAKPGVALKDVKEIYSKEEALNQCGAFLKSLPGVKAAAYENTAMAAQMAGSSDRSDIAVIASESSGQLYGLTVLKGDIQDTDNNYTRFICISKQPEIYPGANRTSLMLTLEHRPGALYRVLSKFHALEINLNKLESRPIPGRDFEFKFYFDIDASVYDESLRTVLAELEGETAAFDYLGSYQEV